MNEGANHARVVRHVSVGLAIAELIYKIVQVAIATAVVGFAAQKTGSYTLYMMLAALMVVMSIYVLAVPMRVVELLTDGGEEMPRAWVARVGFLLVLLTTVGFAVSTFNLLPEIVRYMSEAAHPSTMSIATQH